MTNAIRETLNSSYNFLSGCVEGTINGFLENNGGVITQALACSKAAAAASGRALSEGRVSTFSKCLALSAISLTMAATNAAAFVMFQAMGDDNVQASSAYFQYLQMYNMSEVKHGAWLRIYGDSIFSYCPQEFFSWEPQKACYEFEAGSYAMFTSETGVLFCPVMDPPGIPLHDICDAYPFDQA